MVCLNHGKSKEAVLMDANSVTTILKIGENIAVEFRDVETVLKMMYMRLFVRF